jgi:hypothetical protein
MVAKPKQWPISEQTEKFIVRRYEAPEGSNSRLWIELRWSLKRQLFTAVRSNALDSGESWIILDPPQANHAVAKRRAFEMIAWGSVPASEPQAAAVAPRENRFFTEETISVGPEKVTVDRPAPKKILRQKV